MTKTIAKVDEIKEQIITTREKIQELYITERNLCIELRKLEKLKEIKSYLAFCLSENTKGIEVLDIFNTYSLRCTYCNRLFTTECGPWGDIVECPHCKESMKVTD